LILEAAIRLTRTDESEGVNKVKKRMEYLDVLHLFA
jgi:hypothetical protein